ncbi:MAG: nuclear transport factor 2 family protein, partial [Alphaproteobacteria bacterium]|nr:nuclear transport factor 2 family protein [Alphaproteobacteria bacterium]
MMTLEDMSDTELKHMMISIKNSNQRCIYENDDILVEHAFSEFPSG